MKPLKVGILGGLGPAATIQYYRRLMEGLNERGVLNDRPDFVIYSIDSSRMKDLYDRGATRQIVENLVESIKCLEKAGCDFGIIACNTVHLFLDAMQPSIKLSLINLIDCVVEKLDDNRLDSVGLLGTTITMETGLYRIPLEDKGIKVIAPDKEEREWIGKAISNDFQQKNIPIASLKRLKQAMVSLKDRGGKQILLGCTDFPNEAAEFDIGIPIHESTDIHIKKTLDMIQEEY